MQSAPLETSTHFDIQSNVSETTSSQYGIRPDQLHPADVRDSLDEEQVFGDSSPAIPYTEALSTGDATVQNDSRRLRLGDTKDTRPKPSFQRISEYESASSSSPPRKKSEGPGFKIIKTSNTTKGPQLDAFPNGMCIDSAATCSATDFVLQRS